MAEVVDGGRRPVGRGMDAERDAELDALRVERIAVAVVRRESDHERPEAEAAKAALAHPGLELGHRGLAAQHVGTRERDHAVGAAGGERRDELVRDERLAAARPLVEARDQRARDARGVQRGENVLEGRGDRPRPRAEGLLRWLRLVEHSQVAEHRVGEVVDRVTHDFRDGEDRRPHVDDGGWHATLLAWPERSEKWAGCPGRARVDIHGCETAGNPHSGSGKVPIYLLPHAP